MHAAGALPDLSCTGVGRVLGMAGGESKRNVDKTWICSTDGRPAFQTLVPLHKFIKDFHESSSFREIHLTSLEQIHVLAFDFLPDGSRDYTFPFPCHFYRRSLPSCAQPTVAHLVFCFVLPLVFFFVFYSSLAFVCASSPASDAAGHDRVYLRAGLDHLSRHRGKQEALLSLHCTPAVKKL